MLVLLFGSAGSTLNSTTTYSALTDAAEALALISKWKSAVTTGVAPGEPIPVSEDPVSSAYTKSSAVCVVRSSMVERTVAVPAELTLRSWIVPVSPGAALKRIPHRLTRMGCVRGNLNLTPVLVKSNDADVRI